MLNNFRHFRQAIFASFLGSLLFLLFLYSTVYEHVMFGVNALHVFAALLIPLSGLQYKQINVVEKEMAQKERENVYVERMLSRGSLCSRTSSAIPSLLNKARYINTGEGDAVIDGIEIRKVVFFFFSLSELHK